MMGGFFALLAALGFTTEYIFIRRGLMEENHGGIWEVRFVVMLTCLIIFLTGLVAASLFGFYDFREIKNVSSLAVWLLVLSGILGSFIGAFLYTVALGQIGASHTSALWGGSNPLFAVVFSFLLLQEVPNLIGFFAVLIIVSGIIIVGYQSHEGTKMLVEKTKLSGGLLASLSGLCFALAQVCRGASLRYGATPNTAFLIMFISGIGIVAVVCFRKSYNFRFLKEISRKSLVCYTGAGIGILVGGYSLLVAYTYIPVWQAVAIRNIQPLLAVFFSWILLRKTDRITLRLVFGAALVTLGVVILNVY